MILVVAAAVGFRAYQVMPDRVGWDFINFNNKVLNPALELIPDAKRLQAAKTDAAKADAYAQDFAPIYAEKIQHLQAFQPRTKEVRRLRDQYLTGWQDMLQGYLDYSKGVPAKDPGLIASSAREFIAGQAVLVEARQDGLAIIKAHHLQYASEKGHGQK